MGAFNPAGPYPNFFPKPAEQSLLLLNLTCPKIIINYNIFQQSLQATFHQKVHQILNILFTIPGHVETNHEFVHCRFQQN